MKQNIQEVIESSTSMALATTGPQGLNVVPISVWNVRDGEVHLYDFFMRKTADNLKSESTAALTCWREFVGVQVKADSKYETEGEVYDAAVVEMKEQFPDRTLNGVIRLSPTEVYDVAPGASPENMLVE